MKQDLKIKKSILIIFSFIMVLSFTGKVLISKNRFVNNVYAADESEKNQPESKGIPKDKKEGDRPECPECPDPAKVVLRGLDEKRKSIIKESDNMNKKKKELERYEEQIDDAATYVLNAQHRDYLLTAEQVDRD